MKGKSLQFCAIGADMNTTDSSAARNLIPMSQRAGFYTLDTKLRCRDVDLRLLHVVARLHYMFVRIWLGHLRLTFLR